MDNQNFDVFFDAIIRQDLLRINKNSEFILKSGTPELLKQKISLFRKQKIERMSDNILEGEIQDILMIGNIISLMNTYTIYQPGKRFYRVRRFCSPQDSEEKLKHPSDFWNPPKSVVKEYGRLNKPGESLLYTALNPFVSLSEANVQSGDWFALFVYEAIGNIKVSWIGSDTNYRHHNITDKNAICVHELLKQFLIEEFTRDVPKNEKYLYRITEHIAKQYFEIPHGAGWKYPSMKDLSQYNLCLKPDHLSSLLRLVGTIVGQMCKDGTIEMEYIITESHEADAFEKHTYDAVPILKKLFPEFKM